MAKKRLSDKDKFLIDLSLHLGIPAAEIEQWPQAEISRYQAYAAQFMLPQRRAEYLHAQTALMVARCMGGYKGGIDGFLLPYSHSDAAAESDDYSEQEDVLFDGFNPT